MRLADRRHMLKIAMGSALLPILGTRAAHAAPSAGGSSIAPPSCQMIYRRTLERNLPGGLDSFVVSRDFSIMFEPLARGGYRVTGSQSHVEVSAPSNVARLADLERSRVEEGIFPLFLDENGHIVGGSPALPSGQIAQALDNARQIHAAQGDEVAIFLSALHSAGEQMIAELPHDLFAPVETLRERHDEVELPWGETGEVNTRFEAALDPETRLMRSAKREVQTLLGGEERSSAEIWELFAA